MEAPKTGVEVVEVPVVQQQPTDGRPPAKLLSQEERADLRKKVLAGEELSLEEARSV